MPQDGTKSGVYRSFFSCDDPKGVAECKTIRKSKIQSAKSENRLENQKKQKNLNVSSSYGPPREETFSCLPTDELDDSCSTQLEAISRGTQKLNQVVDTWSNGISFERQSTDIAKDLLRGALDLQESLEMLGTLQEASQYMTKWKKKQKEKAGRGKVDSANIERTSSDEFGSDSRSIDFQRPRLSGDGSSKDCYEELREAIRDGLARQNLLPKSSREDDRTRSFAEEKRCLHRAKVLDGEKAYFERSKSFNETNSYFDRIKVESSLDFPSSSSSQCSMCHSHEFDASETSVSKSFEEKPKGQNVIAKLMGLEEDLPKTSPLALVMQLRKEKGLNYGRPFVEMDFPKATRPLFSSVEKMDSRPRTLEKVIQTVQYKGLVTSKSIDISGSQRHLSKVYDKRKRLADGAPPIVIIKPRHFPGSLEEDLHGQKYFCNDLGPKEVVRNLKMKEVLPNAKKGALNISEIQRSIQAQMSPLEMLDQETRDHVYGNAYKRIDDREIKTQEELPSTKAKVSVSAKPKVQKKEVIHDRADKIHRLALSRRIASEVEIAKLKDAVKSRNTNDTTTMHLRKSDRVSNFSKDQISQQKAIISNITEVSMPNASQRSRKKKAKPEHSTSIPQSPLLELQVEMQFKDDAIQINHCSNIEDDLSVKKDVISEKLAGDTKNDATRCLDNGDVNEGHLTERILEQKSDTKSNEDAICCVPCNLTESRSNEQEASKMMINLLMDSPLFLKEFEELFHKSAYRSFASHTTSSRYSKMPDPKLLHDCAKELLENKRQQCTRVVHPLSRILTDQSKMFIDELVSEICEGIVDLRSYHNLTSGKAAADRLHKVLDKDLWPKGVVSGGWDLGWTCGYTRDEVELIVVNIEQEIFNRITKDALEDILS